MTFIVDLLDICHGLFPFLLQNCQNIFLFHRRIGQVMYNLFVLSSSINLPARRCPATYRTISWLWTSLRIANFRELFSLPTYPRNLNKHPHFLDLVASCFTFLFGNLCSPLHSQTNSNIAFLPSQDLLYICLSSDPTKQFLFIFPCISCRKEMSRVHFVVTKFTHIGIDAWSLYFNGSFNLHGSFDLNGSFNLNGIDNSRFSITQIITRILNLIYK